jgi:hypothetical protein
MFQNTCPPQITGCNMASNSTMKIHPGLHERERERERERECHGVEQYIRLFSSFRRIPIILLDNIILGNGCF